jgi:hypothetical protein
LTRIAQYSRTTINILVLIVLAISATSCSWSFLRHQEDAIALDVADFYQVNNTWTYLETNAESTATTVYTKRVADQVSYQGHSAWQVITTTQDYALQQREYLAFDESVGTCLGIEMVDTSTNTVMEYPLLPGVRFSSILAPGAPLISTYTTVEDGENIHWTVATQILDTRQEQVKVPAGTFEKALRVRTRVTTTRDSASPPTSSVVTVEEDTWYVPAIGVVKSRATDGAYTTELIEYAL